MNTSYNPNCTRIRIGRKTDCKQHGLAFKHRCASCRKGATR